jgi:hypothetical protein
VSSDNVDFNEKWVFYQVPGDLMVTSLQVVQEAEANLSEKGH